MYTHTITEFIADILSRQLALLTRQIQEKEDLFLPGFRE